MNSTIYNTSIPKSIFLLLFFAFSPTYAISILDIPGIHKIEKSSELILLVTRKIEPYASKWGKTWNYPVERDSVKKLLYASMDSLHIHSKSETKYEQMLVNALLWHYLYQLEVDSAFRKANELILLYCNENREKRAIALWMKGINLVRANRVIPGLMLLDSLRKNEFFNNEKFLLDYAGISADCFLPSGIYEKTDNKLKFCTEQQFRTIEMPDSEINPTRMSWSALEKSGKKTHIPVLLYSCTYNVTGRVPLKIPSFYPDQPVNLKLEIDRGTLDSVHYPLIYNYQIESYPVQIKIITDISDDSISMYDQLRTVVNSRFDVIRNGVEIGSLKGISLRCYNRSIFRDEPGEFCAYIIFQKALNDKREQFYSPNIKSGTRWTNIEVRYLISMVTSTAVQDKAEFILNTTISKFTNQ